MSYILDALKKSEQERARGTVPDIKTIHEQKPIEAPKRYQWFMIFTVVILISAGGTGYWFYQQNHEWMLQSLVQSHDEKDTRQSDINENSDSADLNKHTSTAQTVEEKPVAVEGGNGTPDLLASKAAIKPSMNSVNSKTMDSKKPAEVKKPNVVFSDKPLTVSDHELENVEKVGTVTSLSDVQIIAEPDNDMEMVESQIYNISDLPEPIKSALPSISFAGHVYSSSAEQSSVMLNGKKMREGQEVTRDLILEKITVEGVVLRFKGYRFRLGALQDWSFQ